MYQRIVVPLDGSLLSEQILPFVAVVAKACRASVTLAFVVDDSALQDAGPAWLQMPSVKQLIDEDMARAMTYLEGIKSRLEPDGLAVTVEVQLGNPAAAIVAFAEASKADLIAMTTRGRSGLIRSVLGSVADRVIRQALKPLLLYRPAEGAPQVAAITHLIAPLDGSPLAEQALPTIAKLATTLNLPVTLFRAVASYTFNFPAPHPYGAVETSGQLLEAIARDAVEYLNRQAATLHTQGISADVKQVFGGPADELQKLAHEIPDSLIVMSTHGRSGFARTMLGSVADSMIRSSGRPILLVPSRS